MTFSFSLSFNGETASDIETLSELLTRLNNTIQGEKIMADVAALQASVATLTAAVTKIQTDGAAAIADINGQQTQITTLSGQVASLQAQIAAGGSISATDLDPIKASLDDLASQLGVTSTTLESALPPAPTPGS